ncbi:hypothetical protein NL676_008252 [Syzygium grande]|nr:hypothetical protein NL676_008252 [Syzygium grande]
MLHPSISTNTWPATPARRSLPSHSHCPWPRKSKPGPSCPRAHCPQRRRRSLVGPLQAPLAELLQVLRHCRCALPEPHHRRPRPRLHCLSRQGSDRPDEPGPDPQLAQLVLNGMVLAGTNITAVIDVFVKNPNIASFQYGNPRRRYRTVGMSLARARSRRGGRQQGRRGA